MCFSAEHGSFFFSTEHVMFLLVLGKFECSSKRIEGIAMWESFFHLQIGAKS
jgi:hypothetical protein